LVLNRILITMQHVLYHTYASSDLAVVANKEVVASHGMVLCNGVTALTGMLCRAAARLTVASQRERGLARRLFDNADEDSADDTDHEVTSTQHHVGLQVCWSLDV
jgi:hypothetical protein